MIRVFIVAASPLARVGLENLLAARNMEVAGSNATIDTLGDVLADAAPDVVLIDSSGEPHDPMMEAILASGLAADISVVLLGDGMTGASSTAALHAGIRAALPGDSPDQLVAALQAAASGLFVLHPSHANEALPAGSASTRALDELAESLTRRELEVLQMLAAGLSDKEIAVRLGISEHTVKFHVASILGKLGATEPYRSCVARHSPWLGIL